MRDLFIARAETRGEDFDIIADEFRRFVELRIGHDQRGGEIIGKRDAQQFAPRLVARIEFAADLVQQRIAIAEGELIGGLKSAARLIHHLGDQQLAAVMVIPAQPIAHGVERQDADPDAVARAQMFGKGEEEFMSGQGQV